MTNKEGLKSCPFCNSKCWVNKDHYKPGTGYLYSVHCPACHYSFNGHDFNSEEKSIKAWNTRKGISDDLTHDQLRFDIDRKNKEIEKLYEIIHGLKKTQMHPHTTDWNEGGKLAGEFFNIQAILTWLIGEKTILRQSVVEKEIIEAEYDSKMNHAINKCTNGILAIKTAIEQGPGLVELDEEKVYELIESPSHNNRHLAQLICSRFGTRPVPTVEEIEKFLWDHCTRGINHQGDKIASIPCGNFDLVAQAIHAKLINPKEKG